MKLPMSEASSHISCLWLLSSVSLISTTDDGALFLRRTSNRSPSERHERLRSWPHWYHCSAWIYSSPCVPSIWSNLPTQTFPWSLKPGRHRQSNPPRRFRHVVVFDGQLWVPSLHSSMSGYEGREKQWLSLWWKNPWLWSSKSEHALLF